MNREASHVAVVSGRPQHECAAVTRRAGQELLTLMSLAGHGSRVTSDTEALRGVVVRGVTHDSRRVQEGDLFVALPSVGVSARRAASVGGEAHARAAVQAGAVAIVSSTEDQGLGVPWLRVPDARLALADFAAASAAHPSQDMQVVGITGTNGKTSVAHALARLLEVGAERRTGVIGTVHASWGGNSLPAARTTPEAAELQDLLATMRDDGCEAVALEVSSHGLDLHRVRALSFAAVGMTNLSRDHMDWHGDMESYYLAKRRLFKDCAQEASAVICIDDDAGLRLAAELRSESPTRLVLTVGFSEAADLRIQNFQAGGAGSSFRLVGRAGQGLVSSLDLSVHVGWVGRHNAENLALAAGLASCCGLDAAEIARGLAAIEPVPGRLVPVIVDHARDVRVFVDYAHTPSALARVLGALRELSSGRLCCVFGCGGDRDAGKRAEMGEVVGRLADVAVATSDNPRSEDPEAILRMVCEGMEGTSALRLVESDRRRAIERCLSECEAGDVVVVAGKGHETSQEISGTKYPFDDLEVVRELWKELHPSWDVTSE